MNKCKVTTKSGMTEVVIKSQKGQQLCEREIYAINNNEINGLLHLDVEKKGANFKLTYNVTGFITLPELLKKPLNRDLFAFILQDILSVLKSLKNAFFNQQFLLMEFDKVMVNPATNHIYFIYVPIQGYESTCGLREFLLNIIQFGFFAPGEDVSYVRDYINILNSGINFSVFELEEYLKRLMGNQSQVVEEKECPQCHTRVKKGINYCPSCGAKVSGDTGKTGKGTYDPSSPNNWNRQDTENNQDENDSLSGFNNWSDYGGTVVLGSDTLDTPSFPYLIREKGNEKISVNRPSFRLGKEESFCDYCVKDNSAVSRSHADIITRGGRYFIIDLNSTNKTYVDGRAIAINTEMEIFSGTKIRLANEDFVFYIE